MQTHHLQDGIMHKAQRNRALTEEEKQRNKAISPIRSTIERTFGSIRRWFHGGRCRYRGLAKTHTQNILESIAFNLYRTPGINYVLIRRIRHTPPLRSSFKQLLKGGIYNYFHSLLPPLSLAPFMPRTPLPLHPPYFAKVSSEVYLSFEEIA